MRARAWGLQRVAVVDFDVHHGNGTQAMFAADADLFYALLAPEPVLSRAPATAWERGVAEQHRQRPAARRGSDGAAFRAAWAGTILPALDRVRARSC